MELQKSKHQKRVFVIMPFVKTPTRNQGQLKCFFENNIQLPVENATLDCEYKVWRSGETFNITDEIIRDLFKSDIVIADLSGENPNPNVMYELGVRLALSDKPVILIREKNPQNKKVFDVDNYYIFQYDPLSYSDLEKHLIGKLQRFESGEEKFESPVKKVINIEYILSQSALDNLTPIQQKEIVLRGTKLIERNISSAFGPLGRGIYIRDKKDEHKLEKEGLLISEATWSPNPLENRGVDFFTEVCRNMIQKVGDGSKTAVLITYKMIEASNEALKKGFLPRNIIRGMEKAIKKAIECINQNTSSLKDKQEVVYESSTAAKNKDIGQIITDSLQEVGKHGIIIIEKGESKDNIIEMFNGIQIDMGYISSDFLIEPDTTTCIFENCYLLLYPKVISNHMEIIPLMENISSLNSPLLIIAEDVKDDALDTLLLNVHKRNIECVAVKFPDYIRHGEEFLKDIAIKTGSKIIRPTHGLNLKNISIADLGKAEKVTVTSEYCRIIGGNGHPREIEARVNSIIESIDQNIKNNKNLLNIERLQERLAMLVGAIVLIRVGGITDQDISENIYGFRSALYSSRVAIEAGVVVGGGLTLLKAKDKVSKIIPANDEEAAGIEGVSKSLEAPIRTLIQNYNLVPDNIIDNINLSQDSNMGFNADNGTIEDLKKLGILDPSAVLITALEVALSYAKIFIESSSWADQIIESAES